MVQKTAVEQADRISRSQVRVMPILAIAFVLQQAGYLVDRGESFGALSHFRTATWLLMSLTLLLRLSTDGLSFVRADVRRLANDENSRANRASAMNVGFITAMISALGLYPLSLFVALSARDAINAIATAGLVSGMVRLWWLERRALGD